ncbi:MAG: aldo/keto reductase [Gammaproteobacteria bacterium]|nr:aldo/keto reductase [Gammaproteobacteria bacterium]
MSDRVITRRRAVVSGAAAAGVALTPWIARAQQAAELPLITKPIPSSGEPLPVIGVGTNAYGVETAEEMAELREVLARMPELGGKVVDTARVYGRSEEVIGELVEDIGNRDSLFLATKTPIRGDVSDTAAVLDVSFRNLRTERIDLMQVHNFNGLDVLIPAFERARDAGRIRYIGVSTSTDDQYDQMLAAIERYPLDFIQVDYSIDNRTSAERILPTAQERGIAVLTNVPFGGRRNAASLFSRVADRELPDWAAEFDASSWAQVFLKYVVSHPAVNAAIPGTTQMRHLLDNQAAGRGRLPDADMRRRIERFWDSLDS